MKINRKKRGFTMMETIVVVALLCAVSLTAAVGVPQYRRSLQQMEMDGIAKELFVAAQNHLTTAEHQGYLGRMDFGADEGDGVRYFIVDSVDDPDDRDSVLNLMLPFGSIDETVRSGGSYIIRYSPETAQVLDVFYADRDSSKFGHTFSAEEYESLMNAYRGDDRKEARSRYGAEQAVIGYYGGVKAADMESTTVLAAPSIRVTNAERLYVTVYDPNAAVAGAQLKLTVTGKTSGVTREMNVKTALYSMGAEYTVILDDITEAGGHFNDLFCSDVFAQKLIPGEDITVQAVAYSSTEVTNTAYSVAVTANSLFAKREGSTVSIANFRHLENLSRAISNVDASVTSAVQIGDLSWDAFCESMGDNYIRVCGVDGTVADTGMYLPVNPVEGFRYNGGGYMISDVTVSDVQNGGLFGVLNGGAVVNLELVDFSVSAVHAGALVGVVNGASVSGVLARNDRNTADAALQISGSSSAGGLIGTVNGGSVEQCAAALYVRSAEGAAGGLIGRVSDAAVSCSYSGGHTSGGTYLIYDFEGQAGRLNIRGTEAGGLIGSAENTAVSLCYSTCSVRGSSAAGGLIGSVTGGGISDCYAVGFADGDAVLGAFAGAVQNADLSSGNRYVSITNGTMSAVGNEDGIVISAVDSDKETYSNFICVASGAVAYAYDRQVTAEYGGRYYFPTVAQLAGLTDAPSFLASHYGDWAVPETLVVNEAADGGSAHNLSATGGGGGQNRVDYDPNGGGWKDTHGITHHNKYYWMMVDHHHHAIEPISPTPPKGMVFLGWTTDRNIAKMHDFSGYTLGGTSNDLTVVRERYLWDFGDPIDRGMTLYAVWSESVTVTFSLSSSLTTGKDVQRWANDNDLEYYSGVNGSGMQAVIPKGDTVRCPIDPSPYTKKGKYDFCFWLDGNRKYKNTVFKSIEDIPKDLEKYIFDFSQPVLEDKTLYPCWLPGGTKPNPNPNPNPDPNPDPGTEVRVILKKVNPVYEVLEGARFTLKNEDGTVIATDLTSNLKGIIFVGDLPVGTYYLTEMTSPAGYECPHDPYVIEVAEDGVTIEHPNE